MADITSNLDLWWKFDDNAGTSATDSSGNSRTGTLNSSPSWTTPGKIGSSALSFSGTNNVTRASFTLPVNGTLAFWFKPATAYNSGVDEVICELSSDRLFQFRKYVDNFFYCGFYGSGDFRVNLAATAQTWPQNTWAHYALTWVSGGLTTLYCNGASLGTAAATNSTIAAGTLFIGSTAGSSGGTAGLMDDIRVYSRTLPLVDVVALYVSAGRRRRMLLGAA